MNRALAAALCLSLALPPGCATRDRYIDDCSGTRAEAVECADSRARRANLATWGTAIGVLALAVAVGAATASLGGKDAYQRRAYPY